MTRTTTLPKPRTDVMGWRYYSLPNSSMSLLAMEPPTGRLYLVTEKRDMIPVEPDKYRYDGTHKGEREAVARFIADGTDAE